MEMMKMMVMRLCKNSTGYGYYCDEL